MSSVRFIAKSFRIIVECMNWLALILLIAGVGVYVFNRDAALQYMGQYGAKFGIYTDGMVVLSAIYLVIAYILVMGILCVFLEIYSSLDHLARGGRSSGGSRFAGRQRIEPDSSSFE